MHRTFLKAAGISVSIALAIAVVGCTTHRPAAEQRAAVRSINDTYEYMGKAMLELEGVRSALDRASTTEDLRTWYTEFSRTVDDMQAAGARAREELLAMSHDANDYVVAWQDEIAETDNPKIKDRMEQRRQRVADEYQQIREAATSLRDAYQPFLDNLKELDRALALDLTPAGIKSLQPAIQQTKIDADVVASRLNELGQDLDRMSGRMSDETASMASYRESPATQPARAD